MYHRPVLIKKFSSPGMTFLAGEVMSRFLLGLVPFFFGLLTVARSSSSSDDYNSYASDEALDENLPISLQSKNFKTSFPSIWSQNMLHDLEIQWAAGEISGDEYLFGTTTVIGDLLALQVLVVLKTNPFGLYTKNKVSLHDLIPSNDPERHEQLSVLIFRAQARALLDTPNIRLFYLLITKEGRDLEALKDPFALILMYSRELELSRTK